MIILILTLKLRKKSQNNIFGPSVSVTKRIMAKLNKNRVNDLKTSLSREREREKVYDAKYCRFER